VDNFGGSRGEKVLAVQLIRRAADAKVEGGEANSAESSGDWSFAFQNLKPNRIVRREVQIDKAAQGVSLTRAGACANGRKGCP